MRSVIETASDNASAAYAIEVVADAKKALSINADAWANIKAPLLKAYVATVISAKGDIPSSMYAPFVRLIQVITRSDFDEYIKALYRAP